MSGSKDGLDFYERTRSEQDRIFERDADRVSHRGSGSGGSGYQRRQAYRLLVRHEVDGGSGLIHKALGRTSNRSWEEEIREYTVELVKTSYANFGPTLAADILLDKHELRVGRETLRRWMIEEGLWLSRTLRRRFPQPRLRRQSYGELIQIDGSDHRWFE